MSKMPDFLLCKSKQEIEHLIKTANLGKENTKIAHLRFIEQISIVEIGSILNLTRSTVGKRILHQILPKLKQFSEIIKR
mgnify:CR=1 FL=1